MPTPHSAARSRCRLVEGRTSGTLIRKTSLQDRTDDSLRSGTEPTKRLARVASHKAPGVRDRDSLRPSRRSERSSLHDVRYHVPSACRRGARPRQVHQAKWHELVFSGRDEPDWWSQTGSNRRPPACKAGALPAELWPLQGSDVRHQVKRGLIPDT